MGTRADFYIGNGAQAEWLGSVAWDGYEWDEDRNNDLFKSLTPEEFRAAVAKILDGREDATLPKDGWPWPWDDSHTTDYAYMFFDGSVTPYSFGKNVIINAEGERDDGGKTADFPDMKARKKMTLGKRSGLIVFSA